VRAGACGRLVECAEVAPVLRYITGGEVNTHKAQKSLHFIIREAGFLLCVVF